MRKTSSLKSVGTRLLSDVTFYRNYPNTKYDGKKETFTECVTRSLEMHLTKYCDLSSTKFIRDAFESVYKGSVFPSMRGFQFAGWPIFRDTMRLYNCAYMPIRRLKDFADFAWILMCGSGLGFSVRYEDISQLPIIELKNGKVVHKIADTKEGWGDAFLALMENPLSVFDTSAIRKAGALVATGGTASGPEVLVDALEKIRKILFKTAREFRQLTSGEVHHICCIIASAIVSGGVRRSATISIFDFDDEEMLSIKTPETLTRCPYLACANNSQAIYRKDPDFDAKLRIAARRNLESLMGENAFIIFDEHGYGANPCAEIILRPYQTCNLSEVIISELNTPEEFYKAVYDATVIATIQSGYNEFKYIAPEWTETAQKYPLVGVSLNGCADGVSWLTDEVARIGAQISVETNKIIALKIGIEPAERCTTIKPSGSSSKVKGGIPPGIHSHHSPFWLQRIKLDVISPIVKLLTETYNIAIEKIGTPNLLIEADAYNPNSCYIVIPCKAKLGSIIKGSTPYPGYISEDPIQFLERIKLFYNGWIKPGNNGSPVNNNISATVEHGPEEIEDIIEWLANNKDSFTALSFFKRCNTVYNHLPMTTCTEEVYNEYTRLYDAIEAKHGMFDITLAQWKETDDRRKHELACLGGACTLSFE